MLDVTTSACHVGDCRELLARLPDGCVQTCITSPPYWGLRDYGVDGQLGLEATPEEYVSAMVAVFRDVRRVLRDDGTLWLNMGDGYVTNPRGPGGAGSSTLTGTPDSERRRQRWGALPHPENRTLDPKVKGRSHSVSASRGLRGALKHKDMIGIPWRLAFALQADGWYLRSDIIWHKPNPMPESIHDRPTKAHEYLFLLAKSERYFYDAAAIREPVTGGAHDRGGGVNPKALLEAPGSRPNSSWSAAVRKTKGYRAGNKTRTNRADRGGVQDRNARQAMGVPWEDTDGFRNRRSVWTVQSEPYEGAHFATFPSKLITPCVLAGSRTGDLVLDPFFGSGTTGMVAESCGRRWIGFDINAEYVELAKGRTSQRGLEL